MGNNWTILVCVYVTILNCAFLWLLCWKVYKVSKQNGIKLIFFFPLGEPQGKDGNQKIRDKCKQYLDRVEELQEQQNYLVTKEVTTEINIHICCTNMQNKMMLQECK